MLNAEFFSFIFLSVLGGDAIVFTPVKVDDVWLASVITNCFIELLSVWHDGKSVIERNEE